MAKHFYPPDEIYEEEQHDTTPPQNPPRSKRRRMSKWLILLSSFALFVFSSFLYVQASASPLSQGLRTLPWLGKISYFMNPDSEGLQGEELDIINVLIVGMGGENHDGGYLADTIILARFKPSTSQVALVSIPRDFAVNLPQYGWRKINNANAYGGPELLTDMVSDVIAEPVPYYVEIDFSGFRDLVDDVGGVDVYVERSFTDLEFPDENYGFQTIHFDQGLQSMDGNRALQYTRSRHGDNGEGSDFARAARQQKVMFAIKDKIISPNTLLNPSKLISLYNTFTKYVSTNIESSEVIRIAQLAQDMSEQSIQKTVLADGPTGLLEATIHENGAYLLIPKAGLGNYTDIRAHIQSLFDPPETESDLASSTAETMADPLPPIQETEPEVIAEDFEDPKVIILNGTTINGYASTIASLLTAKNFDVVEVANSNNQTETVTTVYMRNPEKTKASQKILTSLISFESETDIPETLAEYVRVLSGNAVFKDADYIITLGTDNRDVGQ